MTSNMWINMKLNDKRDDFLIGLIFIFLFYFFQCGDSPCDQTEVPKEKVTRVSGYC